MNNNNNNNRYHESVFNDACVPSPLPCFHEAGAGVSRGGEAAKGNTRGKRRYTVTYTIICHPYHFISLFHLFRVHSEQYLCSFMECINFVFLFRTAFASFTTSQQTSSQLCDLS